MPEEAQAGGHDTAPVEAIASAVLGGQVTPDCRCLLWQLLCIEPSSANMFELEQNVPAYDAGAGGMLLG